MLFLVIFGLLFLTTIGVITVLLIKKEFNIGEHWGLLFFLVFFGFVTFYAYREYKVGMLGYLVEDYHFTYDGRVKGVDFYSRDNIVVKYKTSKFNKTTMVHDILSNNMDTSFHFMLLSKKYKFNNALDLLLEYFKKDLDKSKKVIFYGDGNHIIIGYDSNNENFYYEIIIEQKEYSYYRGSGDEQKKVVEKNPDYDKYVKYKVIFKDYNEDDMEYYESIVESILGSYYKHRLNGEFKGDITFYTP